MFSITIMTYNAYTQKDPKYITYLLGEDRRKIGIISMYELDFSEEIVKAEIMNSVVNVVKSICL